jgi:type IV pilus assembly protein PilE
MSKRFVPGFTLIELLIALVIVAILATITVPSFTGMVARSRRSDAMAELLAVQLAQERWRDRHPAYAALLSDLGWTDAQTSGGHYQLRIDQADASSFRVLALPAAAQQSDACGVFAVNPAGPDYASGYAGTDCWRR